MESLTFTSECSPLLFEKPTFWFWKSDFSLEILFFLSKIFRFESPTVLSESPKSHFCFWKSDSCFWKSNFALKIRFLLLEVVFYIPLSLLKVWLFQQKAKSYLCFRKSDFVLKNVKLFSWKRPTFSSESPSFCWEYPFLFPSQIYHFLNLTFSFG